MEKDRRNSCSSGKKSIEQGKGSKRSRKKGGGGKVESDISEDFVWELQIRKVWKKKPHKGQDGKTGPWKKVTVNELFEILKLQVSSYEEEGGPSEGGLSGAKRGGSKRKRQLGGDDDVSELQAGGKRKSARLSSGRRKSRGEPSVEREDVVGSDKDDGSIEEIPRERVTSKVGGRRKSKGSKFVAGGEARSEDEEEEGDDASSGFIDDTELGEDGVPGEVVGGEEGEESGEPGEDGNADRDIGSEEEGGSGHRRLKKVRRDGGDTDLLPGLSVELEDDPDEQGPPSFQRKSKRMVDSEGEEEEGQGVARKADSPEIPLKGGLTSPVALEIPEAHAETASGEGEGGGGKESVRKRRRVELLEEDEDEEIEPPRGKNNGNGQAEEQKGEDLGGTDKEAEQEWGTGEADSHEGQNTQAEEKGGQEKLDGGVGKGKNVEVDGGETGDNSAVPGWAEKEASVEAPEASVEIDDDRGRGRRTRKSDVSIDEVLEKMIDHRNKVLGLIGEEAEDELEGEENEDDGDEMKAFIVPDEDGDYQGYGEGVEVGGSEKGASEGGESEGEPTGGIEEVVQKRDFEMFVEYVLRTIQDAEYKREARRDEELMASVRRCEVRSRTVCTFMEHLD